VGHSIANLNRDLVRYLFVNLRSLRTSFILALFCNYLNETRVATLEAKTYQTIGFGINTLHLSFYA